MGKIGKLEVADTLVYIDMPVPLHYWWVTKRFLKGLFITPPEGWPENSPLLKSTLKAYYTVWLCHKKLTPKYRDYVNTAKAKKRVYHLKSPYDVNEFYQVVELEIRGK